MSAGETKRRALMNQHGWPFAQPRATSLVGRVRESLAETQATDLTLDPRTATRELRAAGFACLEVTLKAHDAESELLASRAREARFRYPVVGVAGLECGEARPRERTPS